MPEPTPDKAIIKKSVTEGDYQESRGGVVFLMVGANHRWPDALPPAPPAYWTQDRDKVLWSTLQFESMWAGAIDIAATKMASQSWEVTGDVPLRVRRAQELIQSMTLDGGYVSFLTKCLQDFLTTDNGMFVEIVRATSSLNSQIIGLVHLDSLRCTRTGDPERPVIYRDLKGRLHELRAHQVIAISDLPSPRAELFGVGFCAASRAYKAIYKQYCIETYLAEKVAGRRPLAINFVNGMNDKQLQSVLQTAQQAADARGVISYMGAILATIPGETPPGVATVPLADFPDNFDRKVETDLSILTYANNIGLDPQDLQPLTGQQLGAGAQSQVLDDKAKGKGLAAWREQFQQALNLMVLPDLTTFAFIEHDYRDRQLKAAADKAVIDGHALLVEKGILQPEEARQVLVDEDILPKEFLTVDITSETSLSADEKPGDEQPAQEQPEPEQPARSEKEALSVDDLIAAEMENAIAIYEEAVKEQ